MPAYEELPQKFWNYCALPVKWVNHGVWTRICLYLNPNRKSFGKKFGYLQDWRGAAELLGYTSLQLENFQLAQNPMGKVIENLPERKTFGDILLVILKCERFDLLDDDELMKQLEKCSNHQLLQNVNPSHSQSPEIHSNITEDESDDIDYHAFICHSESNLSFVKILITELEDKNQLKLCIPERDFLGGGSKFETMTAAIKKCRKVIVILSPGFLESEECAFMVNFSVSTDPSAKDKKIIPIIYEKCKVPDSIASLSMVDYTRQDVIDWFWQRLKLALLTDGDSGSNLTATLSKNSVLSTRASNAKLTSIGVAAKSSLVYKCRNSIQTFLQKIVQSPNTRSNR